MFDITLISDNTENGIRRTIFRIHRRAPGNFPERSCIFPSKILESLGENEDFDRNNVEVLR